MKDLNSLLSVRETFLPFTKLHTVVENLLKKPLTISIVNPIAQWNTLDGIIYNLLLICKLGQKSKSFESSGIQITIPALSKTIFA